MNDNDLPFPTLPCESALLIPRPLMGAGRGLEDRGSTGIRLATVAGQYLCYGHNNTLTAALLGQSALSPHISGRIPLLATCTTS